MAPKKTMDTLRSRTIRLAAEHPELRPILLPILKEAAPQKGSVAILNSGEKLNPADPKPNDIWDEKEISDLELYVFKKGGTTILVTGYADWKVGDKTIFHGDQTGRDMGEWECIAVGGKAAHPGGTPPKKLLAQYVIK